MVDYAGVEDVATEIVGEDGRWESDCRALGARLAWGTSEEGAEWEIDGGVGL